MTEIVAGPLTDLGALVGALRRAPHDAGSRMRAGVLSGLAFLPLAGALVIGAALVSTGGDDVVAAAQFVALPAVACLWGSALAAPLCVNAPPA